MKISLRSTELSGLALFVLIFYTKGAKKGRNLPESSSLSHFPVACWCSAGGEALMLTDALWMLNVLYAVCVQSMQSVKSVQSKLTESLSHLTQQGLSCALSAQ